MLPADPEDAHRPYTGTAQELTRICAIHHTRTLSKDLVVLFNRQRYIVQTVGAPRYALRGKKITVIEYGNGRVELLAGKESLPYKVFDPAQAMPPPVDDKTLNARVDDILKARQVKERWRPGPNHPWRRPFAAPPSRQTGHFYFAQEADISTLP
ncbi:hypothetical protein [Burkholderia multivorans]|uniref:hypothetical protein n=1 Tax=Burkholderia multivorans TaxID=87883 RepID=UPI0009BFCC95|nr:hypothetical protein [Burkholderia multivorans]MDN8101859.1 hypothetical protein [Burkholderia multivorans]